MHWSVVAWFAFSGLLGTGLEAQRPEPPSLVLAGATRIDTGEPQLPQTLLEGFRASPTPAPTPTASPTPPPTPSPSPSPKPTPTPRPEWAGKHAPYHETGYVNGYPCGGHLPTCRVLECESHGDPKAENPSSSASGLWQILDGTWNHYGGHHHASHAPSGTQNDKAVELWRNGEGKGHWRACL